MLAERSNGHCTCFHPINSVTCLATCQNLSKFMWPFDNLLMNKEFVLEFCPIGQQGYFIIIMLMKFLTYWCSLRSENTSP